MKKIFIFAFLFLFSCGQNNSVTHSENISSEISSNNISHPNNDTEKIENNSENTLESQKDEEFDDWREYEKYARKVISEIVKLPEGERTKKSGNFEFIIEKDGIMVKYFNKNVYDYRLFDYEDIIFSILYEDMNEISDKHTSIISFQRCLEREEWCKLTKEKIFDKIYVHKDQDDGFESFCVGGTHMGSCTSYLFDAKKQVFVGQTVGKITRDGDFLFIEEQEIAGRGIKIYRYYPHRNEYLKVLDMLFDDEYRENGVSSLGKFTLTQEWIELKYKDNDIEKTIQYDLIE